MIDGSIHHVAAVDRLIVDVNLQVSSEAGETTAVSSIASWTTIDYVRENGVVANLRCDIFSTLCESSDNEMEID